MTSEPRLGFLTCRLPSLLCALLRGAQDVGLSITSASRERQGSLCVWLASWGNRRVGSGLQEPHDATWHMVGAQQSLSRYPSVSFPGIPSPCRERLGLWLQFALTDTSLVAVPHTEPGAVVGGNESYHRGARYGPRNFMFITSNVLGSLFLPPVHR